MSAEDIIKLVSVIISLLVPLTGFITALVKLIKDKQWNILKSMLCDFMIKAENMVDATGEEKKKAVIGWCKDFCQQQGINFNEQQVSSAIETLIDLTKKINADKSKTQSS